LPAFNPPNPQPRAPPPPVAPARPACNLLDEGHRHLHNALATPRTLRQRREDHTPAVTHVCGLSQHGGSKSSGKALERTYVHVYVKFAIAQFGNSRRRQYTRVALLVAMYYLITSAPVQVRMTRNLDAPTGVHT
jgi:hypothetical protein